MGRLKQTELAAVDRRQPAATLGDLAARGLDVFCWCNRCGHNATLATDVLLGQLGAAFPVPEVGTRLRCSGCESKDIATRPHWRGLGPVTRHTPTVASPVVDGDDSVQQDRTLPKAGRSVTSSE
jgi:hypothetical protein